MALEKQRIIVGRVNGGEARFVVFCIDPEQGELLESSKPMTEDELRVILADKYKESASKISSQIAAAQAHLK